MISVVAESVVERIVLLAIAEMATLMDTNTIEEMQFRCLLLHHIPRHQKQYFDNKNRFLCDIEAEIWTF